jgi:hypothetical protein
MLAELSILLEAAMKIRVKRLPLTALRTFEAAARLGRTPPTATRHAKQHAGLLAIGVLTMFQSKSGLSPNHEAPRANARQNPSLQG